LIQKIGKVFFVITTLMVLILGTADWMRGKNAFFLKDIKVEGNFLLTKDNVIKQAAIDSTKDIFEIQPALIEQKLKQNNPIVKNVNVVRQLPGAIKIDVQEAQPIAVLYQAGVAYGIDNDGAILNGLGPTMLYDLPLITGIQIITSPSGLLTFSEGFTSVFDCLKELQCHHLGLLSQISEIQYSPHSGLILYFIQNPVPILLGKRKIAEKLHDLKLAYFKLKEEVRLSQVECIDLRIESQIVVRPL